MARRARHWRDIGRDGDDIKGGWKGAARDVERGHCVVLGLAIAWIYGSIVAWIYGLDIAWISGLVIALIY